MMVIMIDSSKNTFVKVAFELQSLRVFEKCRNGQSIMANSPKRFNKGRTIRKLMGGGRSTKKKFAQGKIK